jgi:hypothetical protein
MMGQNDFLGPNYDVISSTYVGAYSAFAHFDATNTNIGVGKGILLTTGTVLDNGNGPQGPNNKTNAGIDNGAPGDISVLGQYVNNEIVFNTAKMSVEFIPYIDSLRIKYAFASEEYPEYSNEIFNDFVVVRLFKGNQLISNNIAGLPYTGNNLVSVNTVNNGTNNSGPCDYCYHYLQNGTGSNAPYDTNEVYVQYDGFTKDTYIRANGLEVGETYRMDFYITDVSDGIFDSGFFIESCSTCDFKVGMNEQENTWNEFGVYPNPAKETIVLKGNLGTKYKLIDAQGKEWHNGVLKGLVTEIEVTDFQSGVYFIQFENGNSKQTQKLIIE